MTERAAVGRRRTLHRIDRPFPHRKLTGYDSTRHTSDTTSDVLPKSGHPHIRLENTFRVNPSDEERFEPHKVDKVMKEVLESRLTGMDYDHNNCTFKAKELAAEIQHRVKEFQWKRYKLVVNVTVGQCTSQGINVVSRFVWDAKLDNYSCVRYSNSSLFAVAQCYGVYFE